jgi:hypothetical protein
MTKTNTVTNTSSKTPATGSGSGFSFTDQPIRSASAPVFSEPQHSDGVFGSNARSPDDFSDCFGCPSPFSSPGSNTSNPLFVPLSEEQELDFQINFEDATVDYSFTTVTNLSNKIQKAEEAYDNKRTLYKLHKLNLRKERYGIKNCRKNIKAMQDKLCQKQKEIDSGLQKCKELRQKKLDFLRKKY